MSQDISNKEYEEAREGMRVGLRAIAQASDVDINSSAFKAMFKRETMKLFERILDDPETYKIQQ